MEERIAAEAGRRLFAGDIAAYDRVRPPYPDALFEFLVHHTGLAPETCTAEIGSGNGLATRRLIGLGANPLTMIEPDKRFAAVLEPLARGFPRVDIKICYESFEQFSNRTSAVFDLLTAATSYHWLTSRNRVNNLGRCLSPGGWSAIWWNCFQDLEQHDDFHEATQTILGHLAQSPSEGSSEVPFALDTEARCAELQRGNIFKAPVYEMFKWYLDLSSADMRGLYSTFSPISRLPPDEKASTLDALTRVADEQFGGVVRRNMTSIIYVSQKKPVNHQAI